MAIAGFNESYYLQTNKDVLTAYLQGKTTAEEHFLKFGANELRNPNANFDMAYYAAANPDVVAAVKAGTYANVYDHYIKNGGKEGRIPSAALANFNGAAYLAANTDLAGKYTAANVVEHYVLYGAAEGRSGGTAQQVTGNYVGTTSDDTVTPAGGQTNAVRVEGGQQGAKGDTLVVTSGSAASFQFMDLSNNADQNQTRDNSQGNNTGAKIGPVVQGFENIDATAATINMNLTALDRTSITNTGSATATQTGSVILGGTGRDTLTGGNGNDSLVGNDGNDNITGGAGNDSLSGGVGADTIGGGAGADVIVDGAGDDVVTGDAGADTITVEGGTNSIDGGADNDIINVTVDQATSTTVSTIAGGAGDDVITLGASVGTAASAITAASRVSVSGGTGNDTISASLGAETINAGAGNDTVKITEANLGANDIFNGNDGQDIIQLEIPTGQGVNTFVFNPGTSATATSRFSGFEAIALIDSSGTTNAKQYKINLTDTFVSQNFNNGSFLIDARGLPGGSNLVIDFSGLTAASAARFTAGAFRVLTSPSTDVRDQNNVTITAAYSVQTGNSLLNNVAGFTVYSGDTTVTAGTANAYNTDRTVNTNGQTAYTTTGGTAETGTGAAGGGNTFTLTANTAILTNSVNVGASPTTGFLTDAGDTINATTFIGANTVIQDNSTSDNDVLNAIVTAAVTPVLQNVETINLSSFGAGGLTLTTSTGYSTINLSGTGTSTISGLANGKTVNLTSAGQSAQFDNNGLGSNNATNTLTVNLNGIAAGSLSFGIADDTNDFDQVTINSGGSAANSFTLATTDFSNASTDLLTITGTQNLTMTTTAAIANGNRVNASALASPVFTLAVSDDPGVTISLANYTGLDVVNFAVAGGITGGDTVSNVAAGTAFALTPTTANTTHGALTITGNTAAIAGTSDSTSLTLAGTTVGTGALTFTSFENVTLTSSGSAATTTGAIVLTASGFTETLTLAGATNLSVGAVTADVINASAMTGTFTMTGATTATNAVITGSTTASNVLIGSGNGDTITGGNAADTITGGNGADRMAGGSAADTFVAGAATSVARTAETLTAGGLIANETITFGNGVDVITDFVSGTDKLDVTTAGNFTLFSMGGVATALTANNNYGVRGTYSTATGVFTISDAGSDMMVVTNAANADIDAAGQTGIVILTGVTSLTTADFI